MAKQMQPAGRPVKLPAQQPVAKGVDQASSKTGGSSIFERVDANNRKLSQG